MDAHYKPALAAASAGSALEKVPASRTHLTAEFQCEAGRNDYIRQLFAFVSADIAAPSKDAKFLSPATE